MFNLKILFNHRMEVKSIERGEFAELPTDQPIKSVVKITKEDCIVRWPVDPINTGVSGILSMLGLEKAPNMKVIGF